MYGVEYVSVDQLVALTEAEIPGELAVLRSHTGTVVAVGVQCCIYTAGGTELRRRGPRSARCRICTLGGASVDLQRW